MNRILVLDQATQKTGYNIIDVSNGSPMWLCCSQLTVKGGMAERLSQIYDRVSDIIDEFDIDTVVLEEVAASRRTNINVTVALLKLLGVMELLCFQKGVDMHIMNVNYWKSKAGIKSRTRESQKLESIELARQRWTTYKEMIAKSDDVADSLNMGYAFLKDKKII